MGKRNLKLKEVNIENSSTDFLTHTALIIYVKPSDMKKKECPSCAMEIDAKSKVCPICSYEFTEQSSWIKWVAILLLLVSVYFVLIHLF